MDDVVKAYKILKRNKLNPSLFFVEKDKTVSEAYYEIIEEEERIKKEKSKKRKYTIYCHRERKEGVKYVEDMFSQADCFNMTTECIIDLFKQHNNKLFCCYDSFLNRLGTVVARSNLNYKDFDIIFFDKGKRTRTWFGRDGYILRWPMGYFNGFNKMIEE